MRTVGVRELKAQLSSILREVESGAVVLVTNRRRTVAELRCPGTSNPAWYALARMAADGDLRLSGYPPGSYHGSPIKSPSGTALQLLAEDRS